MDRQACLLGLSSVYKVSALVTLSAGGSSTDVDVEGAMMMMMRVLPDSSLAAASHDGQLKHPQGASQLPPAQ